MPRLEDIRAFLAHIREGKVEKPINSAVIPSLEAAVERYDANMREYDWLLKSFEELLEHIERDEKGDYRIKHGHAGEYFSLAARLKRMGDRGWQQRRHSITNSHD